MSTSLQLQPALKYTFRCDFLDSSSIIQHQADQSIYTPGKNAFFDILQRITEVERFTLIDADKQPVASVNLQTGLFNINRFEVVCGDPSVRLESPVYRLIFFKRNVHEFLGGDHSHQIKFHLGWQTNKPDGTNYQVTIGVD
jgi:hypothetical protein